MLSHTDQIVLDAATDVAARLVDGETHTVAASAIDLSGRVHSAANVFHFTGAPCAELAVLGAAAAVSDDPVMTIVAVGNDGRGVLAPCGRCRQVLLDLHPHALVLVPGDDGVVAVPVRELLPGAYAWGDAPAPRVVRFADRHRDAVLAGRKTATVRFRDPQGTGPTTFVFEDDRSARFATVPAVVESVVTKRVADLDTADVLAEGLGSVDELGAGLQRHYPAITADDVVQVARFRLG